MSVQLYREPVRSVSPGVKNMNEAWPVPLKVHPLADAFPPLPDDELRKLAESIAKNGLRIPIKIFEGMILDGRNRHLAAELMGVELDPDRDYEQFDGDVHAAVVYVTDMNLRRRDLTFPQRLKAASKMSTYVQGRPAKKGPAGPFSEEGSGRAAGAATIAEAAKKLNVGARTIKRHRKVTEEGAAELVDAMDSGDVGVKTAETLLSLDKDEQREVVAAGPDAVKQAARKARSEPKPARNLSDGEKKIRAATQANNLFNEMAKLLMTLDSFVGALAASGAQFTPNQRELGRDFGVRLVAMGQWAQSLFSTEDTGVTDANIASLLTEEN